VAVGRNRWSRSEGCWNSSPRLLRAAVIIVGNPLNERAFPVSLGKRDVAVQALSPDAAYPVVRNSRSPWEIA
jgi:hypothetical protein